MSDDGTTPRPDAAAAPDPVPDPAPVPRSRLLVLAGAVTVVGLLGVWLSVATGRLDSALLFVGVPCLMAFLVGALRSAGGWATLFQVITVVLLPAPRSGMSPRSQAPITAGRLPPRSLRPPYDPASEVS